MATRYAFRYMEAKAIKEAYEAQGYDAVISDVPSRGGHGRAGYRSVRGTLVAQPSYKITAYARSESV